MARTSLSKEAVTRRAAEHMAANNYKLVSETETIIVFEDGKDTKTWALVLLILFLLVGAIIYYLISKRHTVTVTISEIEGGTDVQCTTNSSKSLLDSNAFLRSLPVL